MNRKGQYDFLISITFCQWNISVLDDNYEDEHMYDDSLGVGDYESRDGKSKYVGVSTFL